MSSIRFLSEHVFTVQENSQTKTDLSHVTAILFQCQHLNITNEVSMMRLGRSKKETKLAMLQLGGPQ